MSKPTLSTEKVSPTVHALIENFHKNIVDEVASAVARDHVVVVGMAQNPVVKKARKKLDTAGVKYTYLEYGSYLAKWKERLAIKLWAGFPTFPMIFVDGRLEGGCSEIDAMQASGTLK